MEETALLEGVGLTRGEIKVYYALLELGPSTTGEIIKKAQVSRSKVYEMLDRLLDKGLVSFVIQGNVKYFEASSPESIIEYVHKKRKRLTEQELALREILPKIRQTQKKSKIRQTATVYEGIKGIKTMYNEILSQLRKGEEYYALAVEPAVHRETEFSTFIKNYHLRRAEKGIRVRLLADVVLKPQISELAHTKFMRVRYFKQSVPVATLIYKNNVATFVWSETTSTGIVIRSPTIAKRYKKFFEEVWIEAKP